jgi:hypothetical protein
VRASLGPLGEEVKALQQEKEELHRSHQVSVSESIEVSGLLQLFQHPCTRRVFVWVKVLKTYVQKASGLTLSAITAALTTRSAAKHKCHISKPIVVVGKLTFPLIFICRRHKKTVCSKKSMI